MHLNIPDSRRDPKKAPTAPLVEKPDECFCHPYRALLAQESPTMASFGNTQGIGQKQYP